MSTAITSAALRYHSNRNSDCGTDCILNSRSEMTPLCEITALGGTSSGQSASASMTATSTSATVTTTSNSNNNSKPNANLQSHHSNRHSRTMAIPLGNRDRQNLHPNTSACSTSTSTSTSTSNSNSNSNSNSQGTSPTHRNQHSNELESVFQTLDPHESNQNQIQNLDPAALNEPHQKTQQEKELQKLQNQFHTIVSSSSVSSTESHLHLQSQSQSQWNKSFSNDISDSLWATTYQANDPCEDRYCSLTNILLQESKQTSYCNRHCDDHSDDQKHEGAQGPLRMSLFAVLDGHGGPAVAEYASKTLLPMLVSNISSSLQCDIVHPGLFQVNGRTKRYNFAGNGNGNGNSHSQSHSQSHSDTEQDSSDDNDDDASVSSIESTTSSTAADHVHHHNAYDNKNWYSAPEYNDVLQSPLPSPLPSSSSTATDTDADADANTDFDTGRQSPGPQEDSSQDNLKFCPGMHSQEEQHFISKTIQKTYLQLDEEWMNSIHPLKSRQSFLVHNGKWNSGACCLLNIVLQRMPISIPHNDDDETEDTDTVTATVTDESKNNNNSNHEYKAMLYSSHTGDCRAVLLSGKDICRESENEFSSSQSDELSFHSGDSDNDAENDFKFVTVSVTGNSHSHSRKRRILLNPFNTSHRSFKRRRMWSRQDEKSHDHGHDHGTSVDESEWERSELRNGSPQEGSRQANMKIHGHHDNQDLQRTPDASSRSSGLSPNQRRARLLSRSRSPSPVNMPTTKPFPKEFHASTLTEDHTPYNQKEASLVRERCKYAPRAIATSSNGGIQRVAGSLSVTRALGDAYLKTPTLSFSPYKAHAPYISALPEVSARMLTPSDRVLVLASDGVWERVNGDKIAQWAGDYLSKDRKEFVKNTSIKSPPPPASVERVRMRRMRMLPTRKSLSTAEQEHVNARILNMTSVSDMIVARVLNKVRRKNKMPSLSALMAVPKGHSRRIKHDDITTIVVDLNGFIH